MTHLFPRSWLPVFLALILSPGLGAAESQAVDPVLLSGLKVAPVGGLEACFDVWYSNRLGHPEIKAEVSAKILAETKNFGEVLDTEVVAIQSISKRITRYYVAVYFARRPVWIRIDRYTLRDRWFFLPFKYSLEADEILPGFITDLVP